MRVAMDHNTSARGRNSRSGTAEERVHGRLCRAPAGRGTAPASRAGRMNRTGGSTMRGWRGTLALLALVTALLPGNVEGQRRRDGWHGPNPWSFSPYGGLFRDAFDASPDGKDTGWLIGFRLGYDLGSRS